MDVSSIFTLLGSLFWVRVLGSVLGSGFRVRGSGFGVRTSRLERGSSNAEARTRKLERESPERGSRTEPRTRTEKPEVRRVNYALRLFLLPIVFFALTISLRAQSDQALRWGGDAEGGAPFVEADPADPSRVVGFDVEIATLLAQGLGRQPRFVQVGFTSLEASAARGDFDIGLSGIEDTPARRARLAVTIPYYEFREVLTVRSEDAGRSPG
jgi:hypothetical protein